MPANAKRPGVLAPGVSVTKSDGAQHRPPKDARLQTLMNRSGIKTGTETPHTLAVTNYGVARNGRRLRQAASHSSHRKVRIQTFVWTHDGFWVGDVVIVQQTGASDATAMPKRKPGPLL